MVGEKEQRNITFDLNKILVSGFQSAKNKRALPLCILLRASPTSLPKTHTQTQILTHQNSLLFI